MDPPMFSFFRDLADAARTGAAPSAFVLFCVYAWGLWAVKALGARRYRPATGSPGPLTSSVLVPVYNEPLPLFRRVLASVLANAPSELVVVVDGGNAELA